MADVSKPVTVAPRSADMTIASATAKLAGYSFRAISTGQRAFLRQGSATGDIVAVIDLPTYGVTVAGTDNTVSFNYPIHCGGGIFLDLDGTNSVEGCVYII